ncbi:MAG: hypothetical protein WCR55_13310 [Lentisphaerota bacterium]
MNFKQWEKKYQPLKNLIYLNAPYDGYMFETFGGELKFVNDMLTNKKHLWTLVQGEDDTDLLIAGIHFVNRIGYFITEKRASENKIIEIN